MRTEVPFSVVAETARIVSDFYGRSAVYVSEQPHRCGRPIVAGACGEFDRSRVVVWRQTENQGGSIQKGERGFRAGNLYEFFERLSGTAAYGSNVSITEDSVRLLDHCLTGFKDSASKDDFFVDSRVAWKIDGEPEASVEIPKTQLARLGYLDCGERVDLVRPQNGPASLEVRTITEASDLIGFARLGVDEEFWSSAPTLDGGPDALGVPSATLEAIRRLVYSHSTVVEEDIELRLYDCAAVFKVGDWRVASELVQFSDREDGNEDDIGTLNRPIPAVGVPSREADETLRLKDWRLEIARAFVGSEHDTVDDYYLHEGKIRRSNGERYAQISSFDVPSEPAPIRAGRFLQAPKAIQGSGCEVELYGSGFPLIFRSDRSGEMTRIAVSQRRR